MTIIAIYVDNLNIIGTLEGIIQALTYLKNEFEMKDLRKTKFYLGPHVEHLSDVIRFLSINYIEKVLKRFK